MRFLIDKPLYRPKREYRSRCIKVQISWEGHKNLKKLPGRLFKTSQNICISTHSFLIEQFFFRSVILLEQIKKTLDKYSGYGIPICRETHKSQLNTHSSYNILWANRHFFTKKSPIHQNNSLDCKRAYSRSKKSSHCKFTPIGHLFCS